MTARFRHPARESKHILAADAAAGDVVQDDDGKAGVVSGLNGESAVAGNMVALQTGGIFEIDSDSATVIAAGALVDIDGNQEVVANPGGLFPIGRMHKDKGAGQTSAYVDLNGQGPSS